MYWELLSQLKNAVRAKKTSVFIPYSKMDLAIAQILLKSGYVKDVQKKTVGKKNFLEIRLSYQGGRAALNDFRILSKPSRRAYSGYRELKSVKQGYGISVVSTPQGVMSGSEAKKAKVGGEYLFEVW